MGHIDHAHQAEDDGKAYGHDQEDGTQADAAKDGLEHIGPCAPQFNTFNSSIGRFDRRLLGFLCRWIARRLLYKILQGRQTILTAQVAQHGRRTSLDQRISSCELKKRRAFLHRIAHPPALLFRRGLLEPRTVTICAG